MYIYALAIMYIYSYINDVSPPVSFCLIHLSTLRLGQCSAMASELLGNFFGRSSKKINMLTCIYIYDI